MTNQTNLTTNTNDKVLTLLVTILLNNKRITFRLENSDSNVNIKRTIDKFLDFNYKWVLISVDHDYYSLEDYDFIIPTRHCVCNIKKVFDNYLDAYNYLIKLKKENSRYAEYAELSAKFGNKWIVSLWYYLISYYIHTGEYLKVKKKIKIF